MESEEQLRRENAELRAREERHREGLERQLGLSARLREYATQLRATLRDQRPAGAGAVFAEAAGVSAEALGVARASVWLFDAGRQVLACKHLHVRGGGARTTSVIPVSDVQGYVRALTTDLLAADDVTADPRLRELRAYCDQLRIGALLDVPVIVDGEVLGVICHEHVGGPRAWCEAELDFAANLGCIVALAIEAERRREAQELAREASARLGRMAAGVAHDFNNVLTVISLALAHGAKGGEIDAAMTYARALVSALMAYARREPIAVQDVDVDAAIEDLVPVLATAIGKDLRLGVDLRAAGSRVRIAPTELSQLVVNMVTNAGEATRGHGHAVRVTTAVIAAEPAGPRCVELRIADDGRGMDEATRARVFDPFFTTKAPGEGTGIGLATCQSIASRAGGTIAVDSKLGMGTAFRIALPVAARAAARAEPAEGPDGGQRVLLVEDSPAVGDLMSHVLGAAGYEVVHVPSVAAALAALAAEHFDVVVADLRLPDGRGEEIVEAARARSERIAIVVASGEVAVIDGVDAVVMKPFTTEELKIGICRAVEHRRAAG
jgi:signal transduction histidine kinase/CheY-like chemotaxis protein